jgi:hypothetical protein
MCLVGWCSKWNRFERNKMKTLAIGMIASAALLSLAMVLSSWFEAGAGPRTVEAQIRAQITAIRLMAEEARNGPEIKG